MIEGDCGGMQEDDKRDSGEIQEDDKRDSGGMQEDDKRDSGGMQEDDKGDSGEMQEMVLGGGQGKGVQEGADDYQVPDRSVSCILCIRDRPAAGGLRTGSCLAPDNPRRLGWVSSIIMTGSLKKRRNTISRWWMTSMPGADGFSRRTVPRITAWGLSTIILGSMNRRLSIWMNPRMWTSVPPIERTSGVGLFCHREGSQGSGKK